jgi:hypothetical protein
MASKVSPELQPSAAHFIRGDNEHDFGRFMWGGLRDST